MSALLTDAIRAFIGRTVTYTAPEELGRASIRYFALAVGDDNPLWVSREFARAHGHDDVIAPPTLVCETNQYMTGRRDDEGYLGHSWGLEVPGTRLVRGGNDYSFGRPARPTDVVSATWTITDAVERTSSRGTAMLVVTSEAVYRDSATGDLLARNTEQLVYTATS